MLNKLNPNLKVVEEKEEAFEILGEITEDLTPKGRLGELEKLFTKIMYNTKDIARSKRLAILLIKKFDETTFEQLLKGWEPTRGNYEFSLYSDLCGIADIYFELKAYVEDREYDYPSTAMDDFCKPKNIPWRELCGFNNRLVGHLS